jgi:tetratricopeptide (TPR) repeat protein
MSTHRHGVIPLVVALLVSVAGLGPGRPAAAEDDTPRAKPKPATRRVQGVRPWAYERLERAHAALADGNYPACRAALDELQDTRERLNDHERALTWQTYGYAQASQGEYREAAASFEHSLEGDGLPEAAQQDVRYNLAQLYVILKRYDDAIETFRVWFETVEDPPASAHYLLAMTHVQKEDHAKALPQARLAVSKADEPNESWLQLLLSLLIQQEHLREALPVANRLVARFPKKSYWLQLSGLHSRLGQHRKALGALEAAYEQDMLTSQEEIIRLTQLYLFNQVPIRTPGATASQSSGNTAKTAGSNGRSATPGPKIV